jgi:hypothetical protein
MHNKLAISAITLFVREGHNVFKQNSVAEKSAMFVFQPAEPPRRRAVFSLSYRPR